MADKISAPVLIIQGEDDHTVPVQQAHAMVEALEKTGHKPQSLFIAHEGHGFTSEPSLVQEFHKIEEFLAKYLGGEVSPPVKL